MSFIRGDVLSFKNFKFSSYVLLGPYLKISYSFDKENRLSFYFDYKLLQNTETIKMVTDLAQLI